MGAEKKRHTSKHLLSWVVAGVIVVALVLVGAGFALVRSLGTDDVSSSGSSGTSTLASSGENGTTTTITTEGVSSDADAYNAAYELVAGDSFDYDGIDIVELNGNKPFFTDDEISYARANYGFEHYSALDSLGRCGVAMASLGTENQPARGEERGNISDIKPTGWHRSLYDFVDGESLYNRSHLIAWSLSEENANECNLITGTRHMNAELMLPYEEQVADYIRDTQNHVLYRVTPVFEDDELVARGVAMEAYSLEDNGATLCYCVFCYNVEPGVEIDYATGENWAS